MGLIRIEKEIFKPCTHRGEYGDYCKQCGARKTGFLFAPGTIIETIVIFETCFHNGEFGKYCSKCGDKLNNF